MAFGSTDLLFDQIKIIQQPLASRCDLTFFCDGQGQQLAYADQNLFVGSQPFQQGIGCAGLGQMVRRSQYFSMLLQLVSAE